MRLALYFLVGLVLSVHSASLGADHTDLSLPFSSEIKAHIVSGQIEWISKKDQNFSVSCTSRDCRVIPKNPFELIYTGSLTFFSKNHGKTVEFPLDISYQNYPVSFDLSKKLTVKSIQKRSLSCEVSAGADILSYLSKKKVTEDELLRVLPKEESYGKSLADMNGVWGNPERGYVGAIHLHQGKKSDQGKQTGYGVYEYPMSRVYARFGHESQIINRHEYVYPFTPKTHLTKLLKELVKGNMVQLWGDRCTDPRYEDGKYRLAKLTQAQADVGINGINDCKKDFEKSRLMGWQYRDGGVLRDYQGLIGEHSFYLLGYYGGIDDPTVILVWDTNTGKHAYHIDEWMRKWGRMDYRSIIVYQKKRP